MIPNLLFVYTTEDKVKEYVKDTPALSYLTYYYNHFELDENRKNPPLTISRKEMENFIIATCNQSEHLFDRRRTHLNRLYTYRLSESKMKGIKNHNQTNRLIKWTVIALDFVILPLAAHGARPAHPLDDGQADF